MSQDEVVRLSGIPKRSYLNYENEQTDIPISKLQKIASVLQVSVSTLINEEKSGMMAKEDPGDAYGLRDLQTVHSDLKGDLNELAAGMVKNFKVIADGLQTSMQRQEKIVDFVEKLDADKIAEATGNLEAFLKSK